MTLMSIKIYKTIKNKVHDPWKYWFVSGERDKHKIAIFNFKSGGITLDRIYFKNYLDYLNHH